MSGTRITGQLAIALREIGSIKPWWSEDDGMFMFEHEAYPMVYFMDEDKSKVREGYIRILSDFIQERMKGQIADDVDRITSGRGGARQGAGRKRNKERTVRKYIPVDVANWLDLDDENIQKVRNLMHA